MKPKIKQQFFPTNINGYETEGIPLHVAREIDHDFLEFAAEAIKDDWAAYPGGVWGIQDRKRGIDPKRNQLYHSGERRDGDNSILLLKGDTQIWLVDRMLGTMRLVYCHGWFRGGLQAMEDEALLAIVRSGYDFEQIQSLRTRCSYCGQTVSPDDLVPIGFAGRICKVCDDKDGGAIRKAVEFPGWTN